MVTRLEQILSARIKDKDLQDNFPTDWCYICQRPISYDGLEKGWDFEQKNAIIDNKITSICGLCHYKYYENIVKDTEDIFIRFHNNELIIEFEEDYKPSCYAINIFQNIPQEYRIYFSFFIGM